MREAAMAHKRVSGGGGSRLYRLTAFVTCHDLKFCRPVEVVVAVPREPSAAEAKKYLWPAAEALLSEYGAGGYQLELSGVGVAAAD
jgi:hypothetical protein